VTSLIAYSYNSLCHFAIKPLVFIRLLHQLVSIDDSLTDWSLFYLYLQRGSFFD